MKPFSLSLDLQKANLSNKSDTDDESQLPPVAAGESRRRSAQMNARHSRRTNETDESRDEDALSDEDNVSAHHDEDFDDVDSAEDVSMNDEEEHDDSMKEAMMPSIRLSAIGMQNDSHNDEEEELHNEERASTAPNIPPLSLKLGMTNNSSSGSSTSRGGAANRTFTAAGERGCHDEYHQNSSSEDNPFTAREDRRSKSSNNKPPRTVSKIPIDYIIRDVASADSTDAAEIQNTVAQVWFHGNGEHAKSGAQFFDVTSYKDHQQKRILVHGTHQSTQISLNDVLRLAKERDIYKRRAEQSESALGTLQTERDMLLNHLSESQGSESELRSEIDILRQKLKNYEKLRSDMLNTVESLKTQHGLLIKAIVTSQTPRTGASTGRSASPKSLSVLRNRSSRSSNGSGSIQSPAGSQSARI